MNDKLAKKNDRFYISRMLFNLVQFDRKKARPFFMLTENNIFKP
jgi:hypothetical protein